MVARNQISVICEVHHRFVTHGIGVETVNRHVAVNAFKCRYLVFLVANTLYDSVFHIHNAADVVFYADSFAYFLEYDFGAGRNYYVVGSLNLGIEVFDFLFVLVQNSVMYL